MSAQNTNNAYFRAAAITHGITYVLLLSSQSYVTAQDNNINSAPPPNPYGFNTNFNPSMAIIIVVLMSAFFFMGFFSIYIRQCAGDRTAVSTRPTAAGQSRRAARGLDPAIIDTFPTFIYSVVKGLKLGKGTLECAVCLNEFEDDETLRLLPKCDHVFHPECIDAWLVSHVTCPVCRANLKPDAASDDQVTDVGHRIADVGSADSDSERESEHLHHHDSGSIRRRTDVESTHNQISIAICDEDSHQQQQQQQPQLINPNLIPFQNRPVRSKSSTRGRIATKFPRSHSTGHSLVQPGENCDRYTLRLPEEIRKQIMLKRTTSCVNFPAGDGSFSRRSSRRGYRGSGRGGESEGSSRGKYYQFWRLDQRAKSDRWVFSMAPPFFSRTSSMKSPKGADGEGSVNSRNFLTSVKTPFDCLGAKADGGGQSVSRPPV